jgi:GT2 family glycosyltransferase
LSARIDCFAWLTPGLGLLVGAVQGDASSWAHTSIDGEPVEARSLTYPVVNGEAQLVTLGMPGRRPPGEPGRLKVATPDGDIFFESADIRTVNVDLQTLVRTALAPLSAPTRAEVLEFLATTPLAYPFAAGTTLTRTLVAIRGALRERLPSCLVGRDEPIGVAVECMLAIDEHRFFTQGWFRDVEGVVTSLRAVSPEGASIELIDKIHRFQRPDLEALYGVPSGDPRAGTGFACCFDLAAPSNALAGWILELRNSAGVAVEAAGPHVTAGRDDVRNMLLGDIGLERPGEEALTHDHVFPAMSRLQALNSQRLRIDRVVQLGEPPTDPEVSIVVPLYRRIDFLEHQLAQFSLDPSIARSDLIYVLDSPELSRDLMSVAAGLADLYRVPFRIATLAENNGYAGANRAGESLAFGRLVLFLNSDVLPEKPGWLGRLVSFYDATPGIGALGPQLLFEDDSIQHAGLFFRKALNSSLWLNEHYFKGLHRDLPAANVSRVVPAVTAACMLVDRTLYGAVGGFRGAFVRGDFEDSDLCLRLLEAGRKNWYLADVALYHLEGQSYETSLRIHSWHYNAWLHTHIWGQRIAELMREFRPELTVRGSLPSVRIGEATSVGPLNGGVVDEVPAR